MNKRLQLSLVMLVMAALGCSGLSVVTNHVIGSGHVIGEPRNVASFTSVELAGSADVNILVGDAQSVNVEADDNIAPLIQTIVTNGKLVISTKPGVDFSSTNRVVVTVSMRSLEHVTLSGSGNLNVGAMMGPDLAVDLPGSGDITVEGGANNATIDLSGSGNIQCSTLKAKSAKVSLSGSGNVTVYASEILDANISGSGTIRYDGSPAQVTKGITGSGTITP
ncbi:MAG: head GIN domain-containing protein [Anaerolineales bacterium]